MADNFILAGARQNGSNLGVVIAATNTGSDEQGRPILALAGSAPVGGATSAKQDTQITAEQAILAKLPTVGTAGSASTNVLTFQGIASGTPAPVTNAQKQYTGTPSSFAFQTTDATVFTLAAGEVGFIQNCDDAALAVKKGASASTTSLSMILKACAAADDGSGGYVIIKDWVGAVSVAAMSGTARYLAWKQAP